MLWRESPGPNHDPNPNIMLPQGSPCASARKPPCGPASIDPIRVRVRVRFTVRDRVRVRVRVRVTVRPPCGPASTDPSQPQVGPRLPIGVRVRVRVRVSVSVSVRVRVRGECLDVHPRSHGVPRRVQNVLVEEVHELILFHLALVPVGVIVMVRVTVELGANTRHILVQELRRLLFFIY